MTSPAAAPARRAGWSALPRLLAQAPPRLLLAVGIIVLTLGLLIVFRPLTSIVLLGIYVGLSAIISGVLDLASPHRAGHWWSRVISAVWIVGGIVILIWLGRSLDLLPPMLAVLLMLGGLASIGDAVGRGKASERILAVSWGGAQIVFGILALTWPDVTVLVVAVVFGVRTIIFAATLIVRGGRALAAERAPGETAPTSPVPRRRFPRTLATGRIALSLVLIATAAGGWWLNEWLAEGAPVVDAFYDPPAVVPAGHGRLIRGDDFAGSAPSNGEVQRILYTTEDALGRSAVASALVITPSEPPSGPRPVVLWNHGTTGVARGCAPSLTGAAATRWAIPALEDAMAQGWVVIAPDYSGQGAPGTFPYLIGAGEGRSALDSVLAAGELGDPVLSPQVAVWGHSQGGHAALWTTQIAEEYTPGLDIVGTAALAPAGDPLALAREFTRGDGNAVLSVLVSWVLVPYADTYPDVQVNDYVAPGARSIVREMTQRCVSEPGVIVSAVTALGVSEDRPLYDADLTTGSLGRRLEQNVPTGPWETPMLIVWGTRDDVIPPAAQEAFIAKLCTQDAHVRSREYEGAGHQDILQPGSAFLPLLMTWTQSRFAGTPDSSDTCA